MEKAYLRFGPTYFNEQEIAALEEKIGEHEFQNLRLKRAEFLKDADLNPVKSSPKFSLHITEINNSTDRFYTLAVKEFNLKERQVSAYESIEESGDCDPCEDYVWRLELIADSGMIDAEKSLSEEAVEKLIGCSVDYARKVYFEGLFGVRPKADSPRLSQELRSKMERNLIQGNNTK